jgi:hypothetical protein
MAANGNVSVVMVRCSLLLANIRDISRNWQPGSWPGGLAVTVLPRDLGDSLGDLVEGAVPLEFGLQAPGMGAVGGIAGHGAGGGADTSLG